MSNIEGIEIEKGNQSTIKLKADGIVIYIDPYQVSDGDKADIILITHDHFDHCDPSSMENLKKDNTVMIGSSGCVSKIPGMKAMKPGDAENLGSVKIEAVYAYNANHTKGECLGFIITIAGKRIYHAGDTGRIPEMKNLDNIDIAILPVGGTYTMDATEAAAAANENIKPKHAVPIHYGDVVGSMADAQKFKELCNCEVEII